MSSSIAANLLRIDGDRDPRRCRKRDHVCAVQRVVTPRLFVVVALLIGLTYVFVTPPFAVPDEDNHFWRALAVDTDTWIVIAVAVVCNAMALLTLVHRYW